MVADLLAALDTVLAEKAPRTAATLNAPAADDMLLRLATAAGFTLQPTVVALLRWHDGATPGDVDAFAVAPEYQFLDIDGMIEARRIRIASVESVGRTDGWRPGWLPIGDDGTGAHLVVDHGPGDDYGRVFVADPEDGLPVSAFSESVAELLTGLLAALRTEGPLAGYRPVFADGELFWEYLA